VHIYSLFKSLMYLENSINYYKNNFFESFFIIILLMRARLRKRKKFLKANENLTFILCSGYHREN